MKAIDPRALKILKAYSPNHPEETSPDDFAYAKRAGLCFDSIKLSHDQSVRWALNEFASCDRNQIADAFLMGVGLNQPRARAGLSAYAVMTHFPAHVFVASPYPYCPICASYEEANVDLSFINACRWTGTIIGREPEILAFYLQQHNAEDFGAPTEAHIRTFIAILDLIAASPDAETPTSLHKKIRKLPGIKISVDESRHFLEALGYSGILQTTEHLGFIYRYHGPAVPSKSHHSDWAYPVDFWIGKDGVNVDAIKYWFSGYPMIASWHNR